MKYRNIVNTVFLILLLIYYYYAIDVKLISMLLLVMWFLVFITMCYFIFDYIERSSFKTPIKTILSICEILFIFAQHIVDKMFLLPLFFILLVSSWIIYLLKLIVFNDSDFKKAYINGFLFSLDISVVLFISLSMYYVSLEIPKFDLGFKDILTMSILYYYITFRVFNFKSEKVPKIKAKKLENLTLELPPKDIEEEIINELKRFGFRGTLTKDDLIKIYSTTKNSISFNNNIKVRKAVKLFLSEYNFHNV